jgi:hypothetical protein
LPPRNSVRNAKTPLDGTTDVMGKRLTTQNKPPLGKQLFVVVKSVGSPSDC